MGNTTETTIIGDVAIVRVNGKLYKGTGHVTVVNDKVYFDGVLAEPHKPWWKKIWKLS